jgi:hypothetical protein
MASVDATPFTDLTIFDRSADDVREMALVEAETQLPEWTRRAGTNEMAILGAMALEVAEAIYAINRVPSSVMEGLLTLFDLERDAGLEAVTSVTFTLADGAGYTVPAGTRVRLDTASGPVVFTTDADLVIAPGLTTGTVAATASAVGSTPNGTLAGTAVTTIDPVFFVESAVLGAAVSLGRDPEDVVDWFERGAQRLTRLTDALVLPAHFEAAALEDANVARVLAIDLYDGTGGPPYTDTGHITVVVRGASGNLSAGQKTALETTLETDALASLDVHVIDPTITTVPVTVTVKAKAGYVAADVQADVEDAIDGYLDPATWPWAATVRRTELIPLIDGVAGVDYVDTLTAPAVDVPLTGDGPLADAGVITVTVT